MGSKIRKTESQDEKALLDAVEHVRRWVGLFDRLRELETKAEKAGRTWDGRVLTVSRFLAFAGIPRESVQLLIEAADRAEPVIKSALADA